MVSAMLYPCIFCIDLSMDVSVLCVVLECVCELLDEKIPNILGVVVILLLNVMDVFSVGGGALLDRPCMVFQRMCVLCM